MLIQDVSTLLFKNNTTIAVAESCSGGLISHTLTNVSGSSRYFKLGIVAYSNEAKIKLLKISPFLLKKYGAVSRQVAAAMAQHVRMIARTDIGLATTGIAGPTGGSKKKPIGTVYVALSDSSTLKVLKLSLKGTRIKIKQATNKNTLLALKQFLLTHA